jgi:putative membrane protein
MPVTSIIGHIGSALLVLGIPAWAYSAGYSIFAVTGLFAFAFLHIIGLVYWRYKNVPFGYTLGAWFGSRRNSYDRLVHLIFGLGYSPFFYEVAARVGLADWVQLATPLIMVLALSALFEIFEWASLAFGKTHFGPELQGDIWDTQKDMLAAMVGSLIVTVIYAAVA